MIVDSVTFWNEFDMLEFRLNMLWDVVDYFIVVEADKTHSGKEKPFNFLKEKRRFFWFKPKIIYLPLSIDTSEMNLSYKPSKYEPDAPQWRIENIQRNAIMSVCNSFSDEDILMVSDCDEIPSREVVEFRKANLLQYPMSCQQQVSVYSLDYVCPIDWRGTTIATMDYARKNGTQKMRDMRNQYSPFPKAGWHLSYFGGPEQVKNKVQNFAHQELNKEEFLEEDHVRKCIETGGSLFKEENGNKLMKTDTSFYPKYFLDNAPKEWWL